VPVDGPLAAAPSGAAGSAGTVAPAATGGGPSGSDATAPAFSGTNDQEAGVDEPDLVKTDGHLLVTVRRGSGGIQVADTGASPRLRGFLSLSSLGAPTGLFLVGNRAVVLVDAPESPAPVESAPPPGSPSDVAPAQALTAITNVAVVDLGDPDHPVLARTFALQGSEVDARLVGGRVEVVVSSAPHLPFVYPATASATAQAHALAVNRAVVATSSVADWLPSVTSSATGTPAPPACTTTMHSDAATGVDTVSVVPIDPAAAQPGPAATVVGDGATVYAGPTSLYVATTNGGTAGGVPEPRPLPAHAVPMPAGGETASSAMSPPGPTIASSNGSSGGGSGAGSGGGSGAGPSTVIHAFDLSDPASPRYVGSGEVPGTLIGQYAMSEYQGDLRVATTVGTPTPAPLDGSAPATASDSRVTVLHAQDGALAPVGTVTGLGAGERIYAVRFVGPLGYVVTFRQTDPLYVLDLRDPAHPATAGQLALTGYSSFLQPVGGSLLLGVGQSVDQDLRTAGLQLSLFDVTDPQHPSLVSKLVLPGATSSAEQDPHALLAWVPAGLAIMPVQQQGGVTPQGYFAGAVAFHVGSGAITEAGRVSQPAGAAVPVPVPAPVPPVPVPPASGPGSAGGGDSGISGAATGAAPAGAASMPATMVPAPGPAAERELVVGSMLYTVSESGILVSDLGTFAQVAWLPYG
jgi:hypothetical protein